MGVALLHRTISARVVFTILFTLLLIFSVLAIQSKDNEIVQDGVADLSATDSSTPTYLDGYWEFYWNQLLGPEDFLSGQPHSSADYIRVPGSWHDKNTAGSSYPDHGFATFRLKITIPSGLYDPAISIKRVTRAFKLYANGVLLAEVGHVSPDVSEYQPGYKPVIVALPKDSSKIDLVMQVADLDYARGGLRESPAFGSMQILEQQKLTTLLLQTFFIGSVTVFFVFYLIQFFSDKKNKSILFFSLICLNCALRAMIWGEIPLQIIFENTPIEIGIYIQYICGYNLMPLVLFYIASIFPSDYNKKVLIALLAPNLFFEFLLFTSTGFMSMFNDYFYLLLLIQIIYSLIVMFLAVVRKRENAVLIYVSISAFFFTIVLDALNYQCVGKVNISYMTLFGNLAVIIAMSAIQTMKQSKVKKTLVLYNEKLVEADALRQQIRATEFSFLQAQIKPHFLFNALSAIATVSEEDGAKGSNLITDLALYLRNSLEFNSLGKLVTLNKELEFVRTYFNIEQARFGDKIRLDCNINVSLETKIPFLILQPLVENAVRHGISKKSVGGTVKLVINPESDRILVQIIDDGLGFEVDIAESILSENRPAHGVGLININKRLLDIYGQGLSITSMKDVGTTVSFHIS